MAFTRNQLAGAIGIGLPVPSVFPHTDGAELGEADLRQIAYSWPGVVFVAFGQYFPGRYWAPRYFAPRYWPSYAPVGGPYQLDAADTFATGAAEADTFATGAAEAQGVGQ